MAEMLNLFHLRVATKRGKVGRELIIALMLMIALMIKVLPNGLVWFPETNADRILQG